MFAMTVRALENIEQCITLQLDPVLRVWGSSKKKPNINLSHFWTCHNTSWVFPVIAATVWTDSFLKLRVTRVNQSYSWGSLHGLRKYQCCVVGMLLA